MSGHTPGAGPSFPADRLPVALNILTVQPRDFAGQSCCLCGAVLLESEFFSSNPALSAEDGSGTRHTWHLRCAASAAIRAEWPQP